MIYSTNMPIACRGTSTISIARHDVTWRFFISLVIDEAFEGDADLRAEGEQTTSPGCIEALPRLGVLTVYPIDRPALEGVEAALKGVVPTAPPRS
jgi:hypothetical protein